MADTGKLAIDATAGGEAKAFFATKDVFRAGDAALKGGVRLAKTDRYLWNTELQERLYEIVPTVDKGAQQQTGTAVRAPQNCNTMAALVSASPSIEVQVHNDQLMWQIAVALDAVSTKNWERTWKKKYLDSFGMPVTQAPVLGEKVPTKKGAKAAFWPWQDDMVDKFRRLAAIPKMRKRMAARLSKRGMNEGLSPEPGQAIVLFSTGSKAEEQAAQNQGIDPFPYHWATVVARSGKDYVTLENYARRDAQVGDGGMDDPLYFFRMYNAKRKDQSFQQTQLRTPGFVGDLPIAFGWVEPQVG
jgi:hypothetical protein